MSSYRYIALASGEDKAVVGIGIDASLVATTDHYVIFALPRIAEEVAEVFRGHGWTATVCEIPRY